MKLVLHSPEDIPNLVSSIEDMGFDKPIVVEFSKEDKHLTSTQRNAMHLYFQNLADTLNEAGLDQRKMLKPGVDIPWTKESVKNNLWRPIQEAILGKKSTEDITTIGPDQIYTVLNRHLGEKFGIYVPWPSRLGDSDEQARI